MEYKAHFLYPGELVVSSQPLKVTTILGSCVAVCLWDPHKHIGGINHFMLPFWNGQGLASPRYGNIAIERLVNKMEHLGSKRYHLKAKIFGGAEVIIHQSNKMQIGKRNIEIAHHMLAELDIPIMSRSTGGILGRKIMFHSDTGKVLQRFIQSRKN